MAKTGIQRKLLLATAALMALLSPSTAQEYPPGPPIIIDPPVATAPVPGLPPVAEVPPAKPSVAVVPRRPLPVAIAPVAVPALCYTNAPYTAVDQFYGYQAAVLNIRAWPNGPILAALANGTPVQVLNVDASSGLPWAYVAIPDGSAGWVFLQYLFCGRAL